MDSSEAEFKERFSLEGSNVKIFSGNAHPRLAYDICRYLNLPLGNSYAGFFKNGETRVRIEETVRGKDVYIVQPICGRVNDSLVELLLMIDAVARASVKAVTAIIPYYGYAKQEKKTAGREPIAAKLLANIYKTAGVNRVITVDLHAAAIQGFFDIPMDNLSFIPILQEYYEEKLAGEEIVVVSPDAGGVARAKSFADNLKASLAIIFKRRNRPDHVETIDFVGDVRGKTALIIDDMISTGGTMIEAAKVLKEQGAARICACATHPLLAGSAIKDIEDSYIEEIVVADTIPIPIEARRGRFICLPIAPLIAEAIRRVHYNLSVSMLFDWRKKYEANSD